MNEQSLKEKAISIHGKEYVMVADRVKYFNENYPNGSIQTHLCSDTQNQTIVIKAKVTPDHEKQERYYTGYAQEVIGQGNINKTSAMENCETSAVAEYN